MSANAAEIYASFGEQTIAAQKVFERIYRQTTPPPELPIIERNEKEFRLQVAALAVMVTASITVSASHTIPTFVGDKQGIIAIVVAFAAFTMVEIAIIFYSYLHTKNHFDRSPDKPANVHRWMLFGLFLCIAVGVGGNVHYTLKSWGYNSGLLWNAFDFVIAITMGISAPILAFTSGEILGMLTVASQQKERRIRREYDIALRKWRDDLNNSWNANKAKWGVSKPFISGQTEQLPMNTERSVERSTEHLTEHTANAAYGYNRTPDGTKKALEHLQQNGKMSVRKLAEATGVSVGTAHGALKMFATEPVLSTNGNGHHEAMPG